ncbi:MAG TPA: hypothetical protein H9958_04055 [Candidatus Limosilactobacillus intestinavium]|nr:hypothetical protein [Candidatus Limosilactobacillus intestinavium]
MKAFRIRENWHIWAGSIVLGIVLTALCAKLPFVSRVTMMWLDLIVINGVFCLWLGKHINSKSKPWELFIFPVIYLIGGYLFTPRYMWYFALIYLGISYLTWSMSRHE